MTRDFAFFSLLESGGIWFTMELAEKKYVADTEPAGSEPDGFDSAAVLHRSASRFGI
jgi:hypothetical protein